MSLDFLESSFDKANYLLNLLVAHATGSPAVPLEYEILRQDLLSDPIAAPLIPSFVRTHRNVGSFWTFIKGQFGTYAERRTYLSEAFTPLLDRLEFGPLSTDADLQLSTVGEAAKPVVARNKRKVFIVHGHDNEVKQEVSRFIEKLGLQSIILHEQVSAGMTIIEKIERYSNDADFAIVLYTPCDQGRGSSETKVHPRYRARQNVVFEHGFLMAKLGRENVCALVKGVIETPNDISGVVYVDFDAHGSWKAAVVKELKACGYDVQDWF